MGLLDVRRRRRGTPIERILSAIQIDEHGCWLWPGALTSSGYGVLTVRAGGTSRVHLRIWQHYNGPVPAGSELDHICRVRRCCNPDHLEPVTRSANQLRGRNGERSLVCKYGHWLLGDNVLIRQRDTKIERICRTCAKDRMARFIDRHSDLPVEQEY